jgi:ornithine decarboxylase
VSTVALSPATFDNGHLPEQVPTRFSPLAKVRGETRNAPDVTVHVRCEVPNTDSLYPLDKKFGATNAQAIEMVRCAKDYYREVGLCFHVGSQCMEPAAFRKALGIMGQLARQSAVRIGFINVSGGFPSQYPGMEPPDLQSFMAAIRAGVSENEEFRKAQVLCEPGRALVAESESLVAKVLLRKNNVLYINDGGYGSYSMHAISSFGIRPAPTLWATKRAFPVMRRSLHSMARPATLSTS